MQHFLRLRPNSPNKYSLWMNDVKKKLYINSKKSGLFETGEIAINRE